MKLNRKELRKIPYDLNSHSNCQQDYTGIFRKLLKDINIIPIISHISGWRRYGKDLEEKIPKKYAVLRYSTNNNSIHSGTEMEDLSFEKYQEKDQRERVNESSLTKIKNIYNVTVQTGQVIFKNDNSSVTAAAHSRMNIRELNQLIAKVKAEAAALISMEDKATVLESLEVIETEAAAEKPKKSMLKTAISSLQAVKGAAEFGTAVSELVRFIGERLC